MPRLSRLLAAFLLCLLPLAAGAAERFVPGIADLPLMDGLAVPDADADAAVAFDAPGGRVVDVAAAGKVKWADVVRFYSDTLAQLGWVQIGRTDEVMVFEREDEKLTLERAKVAAGETTVRFNLGPR
ncbi:hypothetical protein [Radicibacter daui]|uniref:hypothetical protein n=1 Tax=Radicibacter daui TaxID=3064829 RepID=UPI004046D1D9